MPSHLPAPTRRATLGLLAASALAAPRIARGATTERAEIATRLGSVAGTVENGVRVFRGVPFAAPPIGTLRFRPPEPAPAWPGIRLAQAFAPAAIQPRGPVQADTSEDCLYLNIWAPAEGEGHPVLVWLHGGANVTGATRLPLFDGTALARDGVVFVSLAYRLGAFGFLELGSILGEDYAGSGCNGLRDQVQGLAWVRDNIAAFGGDPGRVTLAGQSAGAKDVCALLGTPAATPLFRRAIVESGSGQTVLTLGEAQGIATRLLQTAALQGLGDPAGLISAPAERLLAAEQEVIRTAARNFPFRPVVDGTFLPKLPVAAIAAGAAADIVLLLGTNRDESVLLIPPDAAAAPITQRQLSHLDLAAFAPVEAQYRTLLPALSPAELHWRLLSAEEYGIPTLRVAEGHVAAGGQAWMYRYDLAPRSGRFAGHAVHGAEQASVFGLPTADTASDPRLPAIHEAWVRFIHGGPPAAEGLPDWPRFDTTRRATMILDSTSRIEDDPRAPERQVWTGVL
jgi:para-nitrobenzyl esterase